MVRVIRVHVLVPSNDRLSATDEPVDQVIWDSTRADEGWLAGFKPDPEHKEYQPASLAECQTLVQACHALLRAVRRRHEELVARHWQSKGEKPP